MALPCLKELMINKIASDNSQVLVEMFLWVYALQSKKNVNNSKNNLVIINLTTAS